MSRSIIVFEELHQGDEIIFMIGGKAYKAVPKEMQWNATAVTTDGPEKHELKLRLLTEGPQLSDESLNDAKAVSVNGVLQSIKEDVSRIQKNLTNLSAD